MSGRISSRSGTSSTYSMARLMPITSRCLAKGCTCGISEQAAMSWSPWRNVS